MMEKQRQHTINVDLSKCPNLECPQCKGTHFVSVLVIKKISGVLSPTGKDELVAVEIFKCVKCGGELGIVTVRPIGALPPTIRQMEEEKNSGILLGRQV